MERFRRIGAFLNGSPADHAVLDFAGKIAKLASSECLHAVHFNEQGHGPEAEPPALAEFVREVTSSLPGEMNDRTHCEVHQGRGISEVLATARNKELDLVVVGRRLPHSQLAIGSGFMKLARKAPCNVLVIPEQCRPHFSRLLVPVDFSAHALRSLETAVRLATLSKESNPQIVCQHVFSLGYGFKSTGVSMGDAVESMQTKAQKEFEKFTARVDTMGIELESVFTLSEHLAEVIADLAVARKMDMVVLGSRGRTLSPASLLGVTAEQILVFSSLPVLVVKEKGETSSFLDALLGS